MEKESFQKYDKVRIRERFFLKQVQIGIIVGLQKINEDLTMWPVVYFSSKWNRYVTHLFFWHELELIEHNRKDLLDYWTI